MVVPKSFLEEGREIADWLDQSNVGLVSVIVFGSAVRRSKKPRDLDVLIVIDDDAKDINKLHRSFDNVGLLVKQKYGLYPELTVLRRSTIGRGSPLFYYSIIRDGVVVRGSKDIFINALLKLEGRKSLENACGLERAYGFLKHAEKDLEEAKDIADIQLAAESGCRGCIEGLYALFRKHGLPLPSNHEEERERLKVLDEIYKNYNLPSRYSEIFEHLHAECFYHGECGDVRDWILKAKSFINDISRVL